MKKYLKVTEYKPDSLVYLFEIIGTNGLKYIAVKMEGNWLARNDLTTRSHVEEVLDDSEFVEITEEEVFVELV